MHAPPGEVPSSRPIGIGTIRTAVLARCTLRAHALQVAQVHRNRRESCAQESHLGVLQKRPILIACNALGFNAEWVFPQIHSRNLKNAAYCNGQEIGSKAGRGSVQIDAPVAGWPHLTLNSSSRSPRRSEVDGDRPSLNSTSEPDKQRSHFAALTAGPGPLSRGRGLG